MREDGGPAFPAVIYSSAQDVAFQQAPPVVYYSGLTMRDYFAAQALEGLIGTEFDDKADFSDVATRAYAYADAMLWKRVHK